MAAAPPYAAEPDRDPNKLAGMSEEELRKWVMRDQPAPGWTNPGMGRGGPLAGTAPQLPSQVARPQFANDREALNAGYSVGSGAGNTKWYTAPGGDPHAAMMDALGRGGLGSQEEARRQIGMRTPFRPVGGLPMGLEAGNAAVGAGWADQAKRAEEAYLGLSKTTGDVAKQQADEAHNLGTLGATIQRDKDAAAHNLGMLGVAQTANALTGQKQAFEMSRDQQEAKLADALRLAGKTPSEINDTIVARRRLQPSTGGAASYPGPNYYEPAGGVPMPGAPAPPPGAAPLPPGVAARGGPAAPPFVTQAPAPPGAPPTLAQAPPRPAARGSVIAPEAWHGPAASGGNVPQELPTKDTTGGRLPKGPAQEPDLHYNNTFGDKAVEQASAAMKVGDGAAAVMALRAGVGDEERFRQLMPAIEQFFESRGKSGLLKSFMDPSMMSQWGSRLSRTFGGGYSDAEILSSQMAHAKGINQAGLPGVQNVGGYGDKPISQFLGWLTGRSNISNPNAPNYLGGPNYAPPPPVVNPGFDAAMGRRGR